MAQPPGPLPRPPIPWSEPSEPSKAASGQASSEFLQYMGLLDVIVRGLARGQIGPLFSAANDAAAAAGGVAIGGLYRNGNAVQIRLT
jgi:hypothetical protein